MLPEGCCNKFRVGKLYSFTVQKINAHDAAQTFWKVVRTKETRSLTAEDLHTITTITSPAFNEIFIGNQNSAGVTYRDIAKRPADWLLAITSIRV
jgi:hypothetical protein